MRAQRFLPLEITDLFLVTTGQMRDEASMGIGHQPPEPGRIQSDLIPESPNNPQVDGLDIDSENRFPPLEPMSRLERENRMGHPMKRPVCELPSFLHLNSKAPVLPSHKKVKTQATTQAFGLEAYVLLA